MARPARWRSRNVRLSVQARIGDSLVLPGPLFAGAYAVFHEAAWRDAESARLVADDPEIAWVETRWIADRAGIGGYSVLQADVYSRAGAHGAADADEYGERAALLAEALCEIWLGMDPAAPAGKRFCVAVLDYDDPGTPDTGGRLMVETLTGRQGEPQIRDRLGLRAGLWRYTLRWNYRSAIDLQTSAARYSA